MTDVWLDDRLPPLVEIDEPNRQQLRRVGRKPVPCAKCLRSLTPEDACFAAGRDAHRSCAEVWNFTLFESWDELKAQDLAAEAEAVLQERQIEDSARRMGLALPNDPQEGGLWTPRPIETPGAVLTA
jgi:hypothetical protein